MLKGYCDICNKEIEGGYIMVFKKYKYLNRAVLVDPEQIKHGVLCQKHYDEIQSYIYHRRKELLKKDEIQERE